MRAPRFPNEPGRSRGFFGPNSRRDAFEGKIIAFVLARGKGERLLPLTNPRTKAAVPFGGMCRLIDFVISNLVNSGIHDISVITQDKTDSLIRHLQQGWMVSHAIHGSRIKPIPPPTEERDAYLGTANAVYQNLALIGRGGPDLVLVFGADHVYTMDIRQMIHWHLAKKAEFTIATLPLPVAECGQFGTVGIDSDWRNEEFREKSPRPKTIPGRNDQALVSMGNYIFNPGVLFEEMSEVASKDGGRHDFGRDILPKACQTRRMYAYDFRKNVIPGIDKPADYWRDVGTIESYYRAHMELNNPLSHLNLYAPSWPIRSFSSPGMPPKVMSDLSGKADSLRTPSWGAPSSSQAPMSGTP